MNNESKVKTAIELIKEKDPLNQRHDIAFILIKELMEEYAIQFKDHISKLEVENKELRGALGVNNPWPITDVLLKLIESTEYLLDVKNYDKVGWEDVSHCTKVGREMLTKIEQALKLKK